MLHSFRRIDVYRLFLSILLGSREREKGATPRRYESNNKMRDTIPDSCLQHNNKLTDVLALVESFRNFSRKDGVDGAHCYQYYGICKRDHIAGVDVAVADEQIVLHRGIVMHRSGGIDQYPDDVN